MLLDCEVRGEQNQEKAQELLTEAIETLIKNGGIKLKNIQNIQSKNDVLINEGIN